MNPKNQMEVLIDGKIYKLSGAEEEMYLQKVAAYLNGKIGKLREEEGFSRLSSDYQAVLLQLNILRSRSGPTGWIMRNRSWKRRSTV